MIERSAARWRFRAFDNELLSLSLQEARRAHSHAQDDDVPLVAS
jgi:hypothetical protein